MLVMEKYTESIVTSSLNYLKNIQYFAKEDLKTSENLLDLHIINTVYQ
jgi:16S rRNA C1402 (ribose-2'-O) methylase RsmI